MFYPVSDLLNPVAFQAPPAVPNDGALPEIVLLSTNEVRRTSEHHMQRLSKLQTVSNSWRVMGPLA